MFSFFLFFFYKNRNCGFRAIALIIMLTLCSRWNTHSQYVNILVWQSVTFSILPSTHVSDSKKSESFSYPEPLFLLGKKDSQAVCLLCCTRTFDFYFLKKSYLKASLSSRHALVSITAAETRVWERFTWEVLWQQSYMDWSNWGHKDWSQGDLQQRQTVHLEGLPSCRLPQLCSWHDCQDTIHVWVKKAGWKCAGRIARSRLWKQRWLY